VVDLLRLMRWPNLLITGAGVCAGGWIALHHIVAPAPLLWAALAGMALGAYGFIRNDLEDAAADRVNRPHRPIASGRVHPDAADWYGRLALLAATAALLLSLKGGASVNPLILCFLAAWFVMATYSRRIKPRPAVGNVAVALIAGLPPLFGAAAVGRPAEGLVPWVIATWIHLVREIVKDIEDAPGDRVAQRRTIAVVVGQTGAARLAAALALAFIPASLILPYRAHYGGAYFAVALVAQLAVCIAAALLVAGRVERVSALLKGAMVVGLVALVAGRVA